MTTTCLRWLTLSDGSLRTVCARFDVYRVTTAREPYWAAYDTERPKRVPFTEMAAAVIWCEQRAEAK